MRASLIINGKDFGPYIKEDGIKFSKVYRNQKSIITRAGTKYESSIEKTKITVDLLSKMYDSLFIELMTFLRAANPATVTYNDTDNVILPTNSTYWQTFAEWVADATPDDWAANTAYAVDSFVYHETTYYRCITAHTSGDSFDSSKWETFEEWVADATPTPWAVSTYYAEDSFVIFQGAYYRCKQSHTSTIAFNSTFWETYPIWVQDIQIPDWYGGIHYNVGDFVLYNNVYYRCKTAHNSALYTTGTFISSDPTYSIEKTIDSLSLINNGSFVLEEQ